MCQPRLAVTRFNVPAKCHFGSPWNQRAIETLPRKDYLINRIISPSILSQLCDNVKRERENNQSLFVMKVCHPPRVVCSHLNHNGNWRYVFVHRGRVGFLIPCVFVPPLLYFAVNFLSAAFSSHLTHDTLGHGEVLLFGACRWTYFYRFILTQDRYGRWTQLLYIVLALLVKGMSISFCWEYLMLIKN